MSTSASPSLEESIQLAIDAAAAANDNVELATQVKADASAAADRLDAFGKTMKPLMIGTLIGAGLAMALGGVVYFQAISGLRSSAQTQTDAMTLLTETVGQLEARMLGLDEMDARLLALIDARDIDEAAMRSAMALELASFKELLDAENEMAESVPQMLRAIAERGAADHEDTRAMVTDALSDLQLALTRVVADRPATSAASARPPATQRPAAQATSAAAAPRRPAARPVEPNPFKYP
ncbi:MAG: hypothetical protein AAGA15_00555 [Pseudomonadota bacterium]